MIQRARIGSVDQVALATAHAALDIRVYGGIDLRLHPDRGLDIGGAWFRGFPVAWISPVGEGGSDADDWLDAWGGGLVTTCGLDNVGSPSEGVGLHGTYTFLAAADLEVTRSDTDASCTATVNEPRGLRITRTIRSRIGEGRVELVDRTVNLAAEPLPAPLLYHVNLGWPLWDDGAFVDTNADEVVPRDAATEALEWDVAPQPENLPEGVWEHVAATGATITNERLGLRVEVSSNLPRMWQWIDPRPGYYVLAIEPANCSVLGRAHDRAEGRLPLLAPGEERTTTLVITAHLTDLPPEARP